MAAAAPAGAAAGAASQAAQNALEQMYANFWYIDVQKDHGDDYDVNIVKDIISLPRLDRVQPPNSFRDFFSAVTRSPYLDIQNLNLDQSIPEETIRAPFAVPNTPYSYTYFYVKRGPDNAVTIHNALSRFGLNQKIVMFTDTHRNGIEFLVKWPSGDDKIPLIHAHTREIENDPCGKMNLSSAKLKLGAKSRLLEKFKERFYYELPSPTNPRGLYYPPYRAVGGQLNPDDLSHFYSSYHVLLENNGLTANDENRSLNVKLQYSQDGATYMNVHMKANIASVFEKIKKEVMAAFRFKRADDVKKMIFLSKHHGDVAQILAAKRPDIELTSYDGSKRIHTKDYIKCFESYDVNPISKALLEGIDLIFFHTTPSGGNDQQNTIVFINEKLTSPLTIIENLILQVENDYRMLTSEHSIYDAARGNKTNDQRDYYTLFDQFLRDMDAQIANVQAAIAANPRIVQDDAVKAEINKLYKYFLRRAMDFAAISTQIPLNPLDDLSGTFTQIGLDINVKKTAKAQDQVLIGAVAQAQIPLAPPAAQQALVAAAAPHQQEFRDLKLRIQNLRTQLQLPSVFLKGSPFFNGQIIVTKTSKEPQIFGGKIIKTADPLDNINLFFEAGRIRPSSLEPKLIAHFASNKLAETLIALDRFPRPGPAVTTFAEEFHRKLVTLCGLSPQSQENFEKCCRTLSIRFLEEPDFTLDAREFEQGGGRQSVIVNRASEPQTRQLNKKRTNMISQKTGLPVISVQTNLGKELPAESNKQAKGNNTLLRKQLNKTFKNVNAMNKYEENIKIMIKYKDRTEPVVETVASYLDYFIQCTEEANLYFETLQTLMICIEVDKELIPMILEDYDYLRNGHDVLKTQAGGAHTYFTRAFARQNPISKISRVLIQMLDANLGVFIDDARSIPALNVKIRHAAKSILKQLNRETLQGRFTEDDVLDERARNRRLQQLTLLKFQEIKDIYRNPLYQVEDLLLKSMRSQVDGRILAPGYNLPNASPDLPIEPIVELDTLQQKFLVQEPLLANPPNWNNIAQGIINLASLGHFNGSESYLWPICEYIRLYRLQAPSQNVPAIGGPNFVYPLVPPAAAAAPAPPDFRTIMQNRDILENLEDIYLELGFEETRQGTVNYSTNYSVSCPFDYYKIFLSNVKKKLVKLERIYFFTVMFRRNSPILKRFVRLKRSLINLEQRLDAFCRSEERATMILTEEDNKYIVAHAAAAAGPGDDGGGGGADADNLDLTGNGVWVSAAAAGDGAGGSGGASSGQGGHYIWRPELGRSIFVADAGYGPGGGIAASAASAAGPPGGAGAPLPALAWPSPAAGLGLGLPMQQPHYPAAAAPYVAAAAPYPYGAAGTPSSAPAINKPNNHSMGRAGYGGEGGKRKTRKIHKRKQIKRRFTRKHK